MNAKLVAWLYFQVPLAMASVYLLAFTACLPSTHPLCELDECKFDPRLLGTWKLLPDQLRESALIPPPEFVITPPAEYYVFEQLPPIKGLPKGAMRLLNKGDDAVRESSVIFPTTVKDRTYFTMIPGRITDDQGASRATQRFEPKDSIYYIIKYEVKDNILTLYFGSEPTRQRAAAEKLKPKPGELFPASIAELREFVASADGELFSAPVKFRRVRVF